MDPMELDPEKNPSPYGASSEPSLAEAQAMLDESDNIAANLTTDWKPSGLPVEVFGQKGFDESEDRDDHGRWTAGAGTAAGGAAADGVGLTTDHPRYFFHTSPSKNRDSILLHGLQANRSLGGKHNRVYLDNESAPPVKRMDTGPRDHYRVDMQGLMLRPDPELPGRWAVSEQDIPANRLELIATTGDPIPARKSATVETKKLSDADKADLARENATIRENVVAGGSGPHHFKPAEWTHPNGHPRCILCGAEERTDGMCTGDMVPTSEGARSPSRPKEAKGDTGGVKYSESEDRDNSGRWTAGGDYNEQTGKNREVATGEKLAFPTGEAEFRAMSLDYRKPGFTLDGKPIEKDTPLLVYHATEPDAQQLLSKYGFNPEDKPQNLARSRYEAGEYAEFAPGAGLERGLYVTGHPNDASGYGHRMLALVVRAGALSAPVEGGYTDPLKALMSQGAGAVLKNPVPPGNIRNFGSDPHKIPKQSFDELKSADVKYSDSEERDDHGRWTSGGGDATATVPDVSGNHIRQGQHVFDVASGKPGTVFAVRPDDSGKGKHLAMVHMPHFRNAASPTGVHIVFSRSLASSAHESYQKPEDLAAIRLAQAAAEHQFMGANEYAQRDAKGDAAGHEFHGNRWTGGLGGGEEPKPSAFHTVNLKPATRQKLVAELMLATSGGKEVTPQDYLMVCGKYAMMQQDADGRLLKEEDADRFYDLQGTMGEYETSAAWMMNMELRAGTDPSLLSLDSYTVNDIDTAFKEFGGAFDEDKTLYRGAIMEPPTAGEVYHDEAFLSTIPTPGEAVYASSDQYAQTVAEHAAEVEGASTVWEINVPAGQEVLGVRPSEVLTRDRANDSGEPFMEIVLNRGADLRVESVTKKAGGVYVVKASYLGSHPIKPDATPRDINKAAKVAPNGTAWRFLWLPGDMKITSPDAKGDAVGHEFHGNRYTGGLGGGGKLTAANIQAAGSSLTTEQINHVLASFAAADNAPPPAKDTSMTDRHPEFGGLTGAQAVALASYQRSGYGMINDRLRAGSPPIMNEYTGERLVEEEQWRDEQIKAIDEAMEPLKNETTLYRAIGEGGLEVLLGSGERPSGPDLRDRLATLIGSTIEDKAYCSTTTDKEVAGVRTHHSEVLVQMDVEPGVGYIDMNAHHLNDEGYQHEKEILLARGGKYEITGVSDQPTSEFGSEYPVYVIHMRRAA